MSWEQLTIFAKRDEKVIKELQSMEIFSKNLYVYNELALVNLTEAIKVLKDRNADVPDELYESIYNLEPKTPLNLADKKAIFEKYKILNLFFKSKSILEVLLEISLKTGEILTINGKVTWAGMTEYDYAWVFNKGLISVIFYQEYKEERSYKLIEERGESKCGTVLQELDKLFHFDRAKRLPYFEPFDRSFDWEKYKI